MRLAVIGSVQHGRKSFAILSTTVLLVSQSLSPDFRFGTSLHGDCLPDSPKEDIIEFSSEQISQIRTANYISLYQSSLGLKRFGTCLQYLQAFGFTL